jgi:hypothetical protein
MGSGTNHTNSVLVTHAVNCGRRTPISTLAPSIRACAIASGSNRRGRKYKSSAIVTLPA